MRHILLLGATGRTGKHLLAYALEKGHYVTCLVRSPEKITLQHPHLRLVKGTPYVLEDIRNAIAGCDVVISVLNNSRTSDLPWARQTGPVDVLERSVSNALTAMQENDIRRIITLSTVGAGESITLSPFPLRLLVWYTNLGIVFNDHTRSEMVLQASAADWTSVRATNLTNSEKEKRVAVDYGTRPALLISRKNVARFMVDIIDDKEYFRKMPVISEKK